MPRRIAQSLRIYDKDVSITPPNAAADLAAAAALEHETRLPGGFYRARIELPADEREFWRWRREGLLRRISIEEAGGRAIWEGRVEEIELAGFWNVRLAAFGYWSNLTDAVANRTYAGSSHTGGSIISGLLAGIHADTLQISRSTAEVADGPAISQRYQDDWSVWRVLTDPERGVISFGSGDGGSGENGGGAGGKMDVAVWESRRLRYARRAASEVHWISYARPENGGGVRRLASSVSWREVANAVSATYESSGAAVRTSPAVDADSVSRYIRRERGAPNIGESTQAAANRRRDAELERRAVPRQRTPGIVLERVWDANGVEWPLCRVRAGEVIRIPDFAPSTRDLDGANPDSLRTFFIEETRCDHARGTLTIKPE